MELFKRYVAASSMGVVALVCVLVGLLGVTVLRPPTQQVSSVDSATDLIMTRDNVLSIVKDDVTVTATSKSGAPVTLSIGTSQDAKGWIGDAAYTEVIGVESDRTKLKAESHAANGPSRDPDRPPRPSPGRSVGRPVRCAAPRRPVVRASCVQQLATSPTCGSSRPAVRAPCPGPRERSGGPFRSRRLRRRPRRPDADADMEGRADQHARDHRVPGRLRLRADRPRALPDPLAAPAPAQDSRASASRSAVRQTPSRPRRSTPPRWPSASRLPASPARPPRPFLSWTSQRWPKAVRNSRGIRRGERRREPRGVHRGYVARLRVGCRRIRARPRTRRSPPSPSTEDSRRSRGHPRRAAMPSPWCAQSDRRRARTRSQRGLRAQGVRARSDDRHLRAPWPPRPRQRPIDQDPPERATTDTGVIDLSGIRGGRTLPSRRALREARNNGEEVVVVDGQEFNTGLIPMTRPRSRRGAGPRPAPAPTSAPDDDASATGGWTSIMSGWLKDRQEGQS